MLAVRTQLPDNRYSEPARRIAFYSQVLDQVKALPGVVAAAYTTSVPLDWKGGTNGWMQAMADAITKREGGSGQVPQYILSISQDPNDGHLVSQAQHVSGTPAAKTIAAIAQSAALSAAPASSSAVPAAAMIRPMVMKPWIWPGKRRWLTATPAARRRS